MQSTYGALGASPRFRAAGTGSSHACIQRSLADFVVLFTSVFTLTLVTLVLGWQYWHANRIYTGMSVAGVPVGGLTRAGAINRLQQGLQQDLPYAGLPSVSLTLEDRRWPLPVDAGWATVDWANAVDNAYLTGRRGNFGTRLTAQTTAAIRGADVAPHLIVHSGQLRYLVSEVATEVRRPAQEARQFDDINIPAQAGLDLDVDATVQNVLAAISRTPLGQVISAPIVVTPLAPSDTAPRGFPSPATGSVDKALGPDRQNSSMTSFQLRNVQWGMHFALDPITWREILLSEQPPFLDEERLSAVLGTWAQQIDIPARDARLRFDPQTKTISVLQESLPGRRLDIHATITAVRNAIAGGIQSSDLVIATVPPAVDSNRLDELGIRELIATSTTYFAGSSAARIHNIEVASDQFVGVVIAPDGIFSFNQLVGDVSAANGFEDSLIIWGDRTAVGIGGGVCQVSTTIFRAAYATGFPIVERYNHGYIVDWYGEPGLDATIYTPTVDFRFRNDTGAHLLIDPVVDVVQGTHCVTGNVTLEIWFASRIMTPNVVYQTERREQREVSPELSIQARTAVSSGATVSRNEW